MAFPDIKKYSNIQPGSYERQMARGIASVLQLLSNGVTDKESNRVVYELATNEKCWAAGHAVFDEIRKRLLKAPTKALENQYWFEEACCQALYNASNPVDPFDPSSAYFVGPFALSLAKELGISSEIIGDKLLGTERG